jgi:hypothetical protein
MELTNHETSTQPASVAAFSAQMQRVSYPALRLKLSEIFTLVNNVVNHNPRKAEVMALCHRVASNLDTMYVAEQSTLLPLLLWLENAGAYAENCKPFKAVKELYTALLSTLQMLKTEISSFAGRSESNDDIVGVTEVVISFEKQLIQLQVEKENKLYSRFRNCSNSCKAL